VIFASDNLTQTAALGGTKTLTLIVAIFGCAVGQVIVWGWRGVKEHGRWYAAYALGVLLCATWAGRRLEKESDLESSAFRIGVVQAGRQPLSTPIDQQRAVDRHVDMTYELLRDTRVDLAIWGETAVTRPTDERDWARGLRERMRRQPDVPILLGANLRRAIDGAPDQFYNSAVLLLPSSEPCSSCRYDKQLLVPAAEKLEAGSALRAWFPVGGRYAADGRSGAIVLSGHAVATFVCYEALHAGYVRDLAAASEAELLVNLTSDLWLGESQGPAQHLRLAKLRAIEHGKYMIRVADTGISAVIDPFGRVLQSTALHESRSLTARVSWTRGSTVYSRVGDLPWHVFGAVVVSWALARTLRAARRTGNSLQA
jgi:apolipoprotein N-acyltransferase